MAVVYGQIESLRKIKETLHRNGIHRFNSTGEIEEFKRNFESERQVILDKVRNGVNEEISALRLEEKELRQLFDKLKHEVTKSYQDKTDRMRVRCSGAGGSDESSHLFAKGAKWISRQSLRLVVWIRDRQLPRHVKRKVFPVGRPLWEVNDRIGYYENNWESIIESRSANATKNVVFTKEVVDNLGPLIAGAIGENLVEKELRKLSDEYVVFNDFYAEFDPPIYNKKEADRIYSIQIDHLLVSRAGVFIIETKNWSKESLERYDLRSPVEQVRRTNFALFVLLNSSSMNQWILNRHHWGQKQIPIKNLIVMINHKPKEQFKHIQVKTLAELNGYIGYFEPVFDETEVGRIIHYLKNVAGG